MTPAVAGAAEILGIDPMYVANEGKLVAFVAPEAADAALAALRGVPGCEQAAEIGEVRTEPPGMVLVQTSFGGRRVMDQLVGRPAAADLLSERGDGMATMASPYAEQKKTEAVTAHVLWMTTGLSCEGDSVAMTSATNPSLEDIILQAIPGMPKVVVHNQVVDYAVGQEYAQAWFDAEKGKLDPFVLVIEGSLGNEEINGEGHWTGFAVNPDDRPADHDERVARPARAEGRGRRRRRDVRDLRRHPGDEEQPDRRDGRARLPRLELEVEGRPADRLHPRLPGAAGQHDRDAAVPRAAPRRARARRRSSTRRCGRSGCSGAPCARAATAPASPSRASSRPSTAPTTAAWSSSAARGRWSSATCRSAAGSTASAAARTSAASAWRARCPGFPDKYMPFMDEDKWGGAAAQRS